MSFLRMSFQEMKALLFWIEMDKDNKHRSNEYLGVLTIQHSPMRWRKTRKYPGSVAMFAADNFVPPHHIRKETEWGDNSVPLCHIRNEMGWSETDVIKISCLLICSGVWTAWTKNDLLCFANHSGPL